MRAEQDTPEARDGLAYEYVLGLTQGPAAARAERLIATNAQFAESVERWRARFAEFDDTAPATPSETVLWERISGALDRAAPADARQTSDTTIADRIAALWQRVDPWRSAAFTAAAACLILGIALIAEHRRRDSAPTFIAVLLTDDRRPMAVVNAYADGRMELVPTASIDVPPDRTLQVWTLWDRARGPVSMALTKTPHRLELGVAGLPPTASDQLFEITLEPGGGSPTGRPTGPVLMKGFAAQTL